MRAPQANFNLRRAPSQEFHKSNSTMDQSCQKLPCLHNAGSCLVVGVKAVADPWLSENIPWVASIGLDLATKLIDGNAEILNLIS